MDPCFNFGVLQVKLNFFWVTSDVPSKFMWLESFLCLEYPATFPNYTKTEDMLANHLLIFVFNNGDEYVSIYNVITKSMVSRKFEIVLTFFA